MITGRAACKVGFATGLALVALAGAMCLSRDAAGQGGTEEADELPVILLTGFEPFGEGRPPNPSWEGIKELDGQVWRGYRLACRELRVEWAAPQEQLSAWIDELHPQAVFSFGQGSPDSFALETFARNERRQLPDNRNKLPQTALIAADGPSEFRSSVDTKKLAVALIKNGFPTSVSDDAGQYLCEETLYTLELLKSQQRVAGDVLFCHVPPLGAKIADREVDVAYVQSFVQSLLAAWDDGDSKPTLNTAGAPTLHQAVDPQEKAIRDLIDRYFSTWSAQDIDRYGQCFMPQAAIQLVNKEGGLVTMPLRQFLMTQRKAHEENTEPMKETPESVEVRFEANLARVIVFWKLTVGEREETGYDHFTFMQSGGQWRIANLIFYESAKLGPERDSSP
jgi:pyroglutamyl-peptidase